MAKSKYSLNLTQIIFSVTYIIITINNQNQTKLFDLKNKLKHEERKMCCKLRIHVIVISIISLIITGLAYWGLISTYVLYNNLTLTYVLCLYWLVSGIMCLAGAIENKRFLLIPFMIGMCLIILICIPWLILTIYYWVLGRSLEGMTPNLTALLFLIYIVILLGPSIYFLGIVVKFYKELASETVAGQGDGCNSTALCFPDRVPTFNGLCIT